MLKYPFSLFDISPASFSRRLSFSCWFPFWRRRIRLFWTYESSWLKLRFFFNLTGSQMVIFHYFVTFITVQYWYIADTSLWLVMTFQPKTIQTFASMLFLTGIWLFLTDASNQWIRRFLVQDIKCILYQIIYFQQFKHNHCCIFSSIECCNNYNSRVS